MAMKIKDLEPNATIVGIKVKHPKTEKPVLIKSVWTLGVWFGAEGSTKVEPYFISSIDEIMELEIIP